MTLLANMFNLHLGLGPYNAMQYIAGYFNFALIMDSDILFHKYGLIEAMKEILPEKFICCFNAIILSKLVSIHNQIAKNRNIYICLFII